MYQTKPLLERDYYNIFSRGAQEPKNRRGGFAQKVRKRYRAFFAGKRLRLQAHFEANRRASGGT